MTTESSKILRATTNNSRAIISLIIGILMKISKIASFLDFSCPNKFSLFISRKRFSISHRAAYKAATSLPASSFSGILVVTCLITEDEFSTVGRIYFDNLD
jgi:hypothetical protein